VQVVSRESVEDDGRRRWRAVMCGYGWLGG